MSDHLAARFGDATCAVLFYGSCLRRQSPEGVLDFYVLVDDYRRAYPSRRLAFWNRVLPPNVLYVEHRGEDGETLRAKVAVLSLDDFERAVRADWSEIRVWARFAQPARLTHSRDEVSANRVAEAVAQSLRSFVSHAPAWLADDEGVARFDALRFFSRAFGCTYGAEFRSESEDAVRALFAAAPERYRDALCEALAEVAEAGAFSHRVEHGEHVVQIDPRDVSSARSEWEERRRRSRRTAALGLAKCVFTFEGWADYGLWKLERHRGAPIEISERQRRHPLVLGWPVLFRLLRERSLR